LNLDFRYPFLCFCHFRILTEPEECWHFLPLTKKNCFGGNNKQNMAALENVLDEVFVKAFNTRISITATK